MTLDDYKAEIGRLTTERDKWLQEANQLEQSHKIIAAERDLLRAALKELQALGEEGMKPNYAEWLTFHDKVADVARRALMASGYSAGTITAN